MEEVEDPMDEWFFNSFKKYHKLQMFGIDKPILGMDLSSTTSVCLACKQSGNTVFEVLNLELPNKLYQLENEPDSINTSRDLKIKCGTLTTNQLIDMKTIFNKNKVILSKEGINNVILYQISTNNSDQMIPIVSFDSQIDSGKLAINHLNNTFIVWGRDNTWQNGKLFDIENNKCLLVFKDELNDATNNYVPQFISKDKLIVLNSNNGAFDIYSATNSQHIINIRQPEANTAKWFSNTAYVNLEETTNNNFQLISNAGDLVVYDLRCLRTPKIYKRNLFPECNNDIHINLDPSNLKKTAISGFDENIYIIEEESGGDENIKLKFKHEGHLFVESEYSSHNKITTSCALWLPMCGNNTLLSSANNGSIQGWQYIS